MNDERIAITGVGIVSALGVGASRTFERMVNGDRGFSEISLFDTTGQRTALAGEVRGFVVGEAVGGRDPSRWSRSDALALVAAREALSSAGLDETPRSLGLAVGVTTGGMLEAEPWLATLPETRAALRNEPRLVSYPLSSTVDRLAELFHPARTATLCSACSSGANAIIHAAAWLGSGTVERVLAGGTDALCRLTVTGFNALGATDTAACRPFDKTRAGLTLGEGAAFLVLERESAARQRGAPVLAWFSGWAAGAEAHHITHPEPSARRPAELLREAMRRAKLEPRDVDYVNAHGTGTLPNDAVETAAIVAAFGADAARVLVSSSKGQIGHTLGAAGAVEAAITVLALHRQIVPPTGGLVTPDEACRLNHVAGRGRPEPLRAAVSSSFGFGGTGSVLLFERTDAEPRAGATPVVRVAVTGAASVGVRGFLVGEDNAAYREPATQTVEPLEARAKALLDPARSRRFDAQTSLVAAGADAALRSAALGPEAAGLVAGTAFANVERTVAFVRTLAEKGPRRAPPADFPHLVPSAASGNASIYLGIAGPVLTTSDRDASADAALSIACDWVAAGFADAVVAGSAEPLDVYVRDVLGPVCGGARGVARGEGSSWVVLESAAAPLRPGMKRLAEVRERIQSSLAELDRVAIDKPARAERALVLCQWDAPQIDWFLARSEWQSASRLAMTERAGAHDGVGGFAWVTAAGLLSSGKIDEALIVGGNTERVYVTRLVRAE